jgi:hypothetical protein
MAALPRIFHKIFGLSGTSDNFGKFGSAKAGAAVTTKDVATIMALGAWDTGWQDAIMGANKAPVLEEMNGHMFVHSRQIGYLFESGIPEYDDSTTYYIGSVVRVGQYWYRSLADNNLANTPPAAASDANWQLANGAPAPIRWIAQGDAMMASSIVQVIMERNTVLREIHISCNTPPAGSYLEIDIKIDGVSIFVSGKKPRISDGTTLNAPIASPNRVYITCTETDGAYSATPAYGQNIGQIDITKNVIAAGAVVSLDITHVGSTTPGGSDLLIAAPLI